MPAYPLPDWIHGADVVGAFSQGANIGARQAALEQEGALGWARLQQASQIAANNLAAEQHRTEMELQAKQEVTQQQEARRAQELAVEKAYKDAEIGLRKSALKEKSTQAALQFQGQQKWKTDIAAMMDGGVDQETAIMKATLSNPAMLKAATPLLSAIQRGKAKEPVEPEMRTAYTDDGEFPYLMNPRSGAVTMLRRPQDIEGRQLKMNEINQLERKAAALQKAQDADLLGQKANDSTAKDPGVQANRKRYQARKLAIEAMEARIEALRGKGDAVEASKPQRFKYDPETKSISPVGAATAAADNFTEDADSY